MKSLITATLSVLVLSTSAFAADANIRSCPLSPKAQKKHESTPLIEGESRACSNRAHYSAYNSKTNTIELTGAESYGNGQFGECEGETLQEPWGYKVQGNNDCSTKFVDLDIHSAGRYEYWVEIPEDASEEKAAELWQSFTVFAPDVCEGLNQVKKGQTKIELKNLSTKNGYFKSRDEKIHIDFRARCYIQD